MSSPAPVVPKEPIRRKYLNQTDIPLALAVFLASDPYDHDPSPSTISATSLIRPLRPLILAGRVPREEALIEIGDVVQSRIGHAIHDAIEWAWMENYPSAMAELGFPPGLIRRIRLNPTRQTLATDPDIVPVYTEQRHHKNVTVAGHTFGVSGKMDFIAEGALQDYKSTTCFHYQNQTKAEANRLQGSIYRWLVPELLTSDTLHVHYIFLDWAAYRLKTEKNYPPRRVLSVKVPLMSIAETDAWIRAKLADYARYHAAPEEEIPLCTAEELWQREPHWKYYQNSDSYARGTRSTKNFDNRADAYQRLQKDGGQGLVVEVPSEAVACKYCPAFNACSQKDHLIQTGALKL